MVNIRNKAVSIYLALVIFNFFFPQFRQREARWWTWISIRLISWKEKRAKARINAKKIIRRLCHVCVKPGSGTRHGFGPRNSKIVYQNSRWSTIPTFNMIKVNRGSGCGDTNVSCQLKFLPFVSCQLNGY